MKATVSRADLLGVIEVVERAVNTKSSLAILGSLMLEVAEDKLLAVSTDMEMTLEAGCGILPGSGKSGKVAVIGDTFASVVKSLPLPQIELEATKEALIVKSGRSRYKVPLVVNEAWPVIPEVTPRGIVHLREDLLKLTLERTLPAAGTDTSRAHLCGTLWRLGEGLTMVGTDTHRLHVAACGLTGGNNPSMDLLIGSRPCRELVRFLDGEGQALVTTDGVCVQIGGQFGRMTARLTAGAFPNFGRHAPDHDAGMVVYREELAGALKRVAIVAAGAADRIVVKYHAGLEITCLAENGGTAEELVSIQETTMPAEGAFAVSVKNFLQAVQCCPDEKVTLRKQEGFRPLFVSGESLERYFAVLTPMHLGEVAE